MKKCVIICLFGILANSPVFAQDSVNQNAAATPLTADIITRRIKKASKVNPDSRLLNDILGEYFECKIFNTIVNGTVDLRDGTMLGLSNFSYQIEIINPTLFQITIGFKSVEISFNYEAKTKYFESKGVLTATLNDVKAASTLAVVGNNFKNEGNIILEFSDTHLNLSGMGVLQDYVSELVKEPFMAIVAKLVNNTYGLDIVNSCVDVMNNVADY